MKRLSIVRTWLVVVVCSLAMAGAGAVSAHAAGWKVPRSHGPASKQIVSRETGERSGTIIISTQDRTLDVVLDATTVARYSIGVGRDGFTWTGVVKVGHKAEWPSWRPPSEMRAREPGLPEMVPPGPHNPLGARALYLYRNGTDTLYRIHGTNDTGSVGDFVSSGCFRLSNKDVLELYENVKIGTKVIVK